MRTSKYVGKEFKGWKISHIGIASVQGAHNKYAYHRNYYYLAERETSDGKCLKQIRLNAKQMQMLAAGTFDVEAFADGHVHSQKATARTNYAFN